LQSTPAPEENQVILCCGVLAFCVTHRAQLFFPCCFLSDFSNVISKSDIKALAEADEQEVVAEIQVNFESFK